MALSKIFVAPKNGQGGVKKSKKNFQKAYSKDGKNKFWDLWCHNCKKSIFGDMLVTVDPPPLPPVTVTRLRPIFYFIRELLGEHFTRKVLLGVNFTTSKIT